MIVRPCRSPTTVLYVRIPPLGSLRRLVEYYEGANICEYGSVAVDAMIYE